MKWLAAMVLGAALIAPAQADDRVELCIVIGAAAENVMKARQAGVSLSNMMGLVPDNNVGPIIREMVLMAYSDYTQMHGQQMRQLKIDRFRDTWQSACLQNIRGEWM